MHWCIFAWKSGYHCFLYSALRPKSWVGFQLGSVLLSEKSITFDLPSVFKLEKDWKSARIWYL